MLVTAIALALTDAVILWRHLAPVYAPITYIGVDSVGLFLPLSQKDATLIDGQWVPDVSVSQAPTQDMRGNDHPLTLVTLTPSAPYGNLIEEIRNLKARGICNAVIRANDGRGMPDGLDDIVLWRGERSVFVPAFVLCGQSIGDAGFYGTVPPDGMVRID